MINLNKLELIEFQKHKNLTLDFSNGVNILHGSSDSGKSCVRRAIEFLCDFNVCDGIRKTGSKKTSVKGWFSNGNIITRIRSSSINRYILEKNGTEQSFDAIGRSAPEEIINAIGIHPLEIDGKKFYLNSFPQISLPFLFDLSPSDRAKILNKLTGNDVLDKLFGEFNKDILRIKRNLKEETQQSEDREIILKSKKIEMEKAEVIHSRLKNRLKNIKTLNDKYCKLVELKELCEKNKIQSEETTKTLKTLKFPQPEDIKQLTEKIKRFDVLLTHKNSSEKVEIGINRVSEQLKDLKPIQVDLNELRGKIESFQTSRDLFLQLQEKTGLISAIGKDLKILDKDIEYSNKELKKYKICPQCEGKGLIKNEEVKL